MSFKVGLVGLPNVGKSTLFRAITKKQVVVENYPFCTIDPNVGTVMVPDQRLEALAKISGSKKTIGTTIEFVDIAGLVKEAHKGKGLGNKFLSHIRGVDAVVQVLRGFEDKDVSHVEGEVDWERDKKIVDLELIIADLEMVEKITEKLSREVKSGDKKTKLKLDTLEKVKEFLKEEKKIKDIELEKEEREMVEEFDFLTLKPTIYLKNTDKEKTKEETDNTLQVNAKIEDEVAELSPDEAREYLKSFGIEESGLSTLIRKCYEALSLISFFTFNDKETRAWTVERDSDVLVAAGKVHSDFRDNFIRAEVIFWRDLVDLGDWTKAREEGEIKDKGKDYIVQDGDVIFFKVNK